MANFSTLFPNLQLDLDYSGDGTTANATDVAISTWARGGNTAELPLAKIPSIPISKISDFSFGEVHTIMLTDAQTSATDGTPSLAEIATFLSGNAQTPVAIHEGDVVVATGTESGGTTGDGVTITVLYTNGTSKDSGTDTFLAADLHQIASGATGIQTIAEGVGIDISGSNNTIAIDLSELPDNTAALTSADELVVLDGGAQGRKAASEIGLSIFNNDSGFTTNTGTVTGATAGNADTITVSGSTTSPVITAVTAAIADGGTGLATADQIFDHVTTRISGLTSNAGTLTGIDAGTNIRIDDGATATPEVNLADDVDIVGTLDVSGNATFDSNVTLGAFGITEALATLVGFSANATNFNVNASSSSTLAAPSWNINSQSYDGNTTGSNLSIGNAAFSLNSATAGSGSISAGTSGLDISSSSTAADGIDINSSGGIEIDAVGEIRLAGNGIATAASDSTPQALVVGDNGHVMSQAFPSTAPSAYEALVNQSGTVGVTSTDFNKVIFLTGTGARIVNLSDGTAAGQWVKIFNDGAGTTDTVINGTIVGGNLTIDDTTANFEMIWDGSIWRILTA